MELVTTEELSQNVLTGPSNGILNIRSLKRNPSRSSTAIRIAVNSDPKVEVSIGIPKDRRSIYED